jgi:putative flippase GtrA
MMLAIHSSTWARQFAKFFVVGCGNVLVSFTIFIICYKYFPFGNLVTEMPGPLGRAIATGLGRIGVQSVDAAVANTLGCIGGMANSFLLNKYWTFGANGMTALQLRRFIVLNIVVISGSSLLIFACVDILQAPYLPVWVLATGSAMVANFLGNKFWTFNGSRHPRAMPSGAPANGGH